MLRRRLRRRARLDLLLAAATVGGAGLLPADPHDGLLFALAALSIALLLFVIRRSCDFATLASVAHAQQRALATRGISLSDWQSGVPLAAWQQRG